MWRTSHPKKLYFTLIRLSLYGFSFLTTWRVLTIQDFQNIKLTKKNISPANIHFLTNSQFFEKSLNLDMIGLLTDNFLNKKVIDDHLSAHELQTHESCKINKIFLWCSKYKLPFLLIDIHFFNNKIYHRIHPFPFEN